MFNKWAIAREHILELPFRLKTLFNIAEDRLKKWLNFDDFIV